eukprot:TRINITY_DN8484_c0_g1_i1.p1 TRINITY_DN8484_c0_g1~~TRINITY_DN8484_c0_g1_i1.p1  ORF type:complete len:431 (+),score=83.46 TRINITY_DN8484_c0_g1_i1:99-1391(+)
MAMGMYVVPLIFFFVGFLWCSYGDQLDIPITWGDPVDLISHPCSRNTSSVTKLVHSNYEIHWLDNNPSLIIYPVSGGELLWDMCFVVDFQAWREKGARYNSCILGKQSFGTYTYSCPEVIMSSTSLKDLDWSFTKFASNITWVAEIGDGGIIELGFESIFADTNRTFYSQDGNATRTLELLKDSFEFSFRLKNYTIGYEYPQLLGGDLYTYEISIGFLMADAVKKYQIPSLTTEPVLIPERLLDLTTFAPYAVDEPQINFHMQKEDGLFNVSLGMATFFQSDPPTSSVLLADKLKNPDFIGFDLPNGETGGDIYYNDTLLGQTFVISFAMSIEGPQTVYFDPNIALLLNRNSGDGDDGGDGEIGDGGDEVADGDGGDGSSDVSHDLVIGLVVGLVGGAILLIAIAVVVSIVLVKYKSKKLKSLLSNDMNL